MLFASMDNSDRPDPKPDSRTQAIELERQLSVLIDNWRMYPDKLTEPVWYLTRITLADYMSWAEALFEENHPIMTLVRNLRSVGSYDRSLLPDERILTKEEALEYLLMIREAVKSWLGSGGGGGSWQVPGPKPIRHHQPNSTSLILKRESATFYGIVTFSSAWHDF
jgi:hypothetical protein